MRRKHKFIAAACALAMTLCAGCQPTPETEAVTSKNDGAFAAALENTADETATADEPEYYTDSFASTDGSISYTVALDVPDGSAALPVLRVTPEDISAETAERIARAFFGDTELYEYTEELTKSEITDEILSYKQIISDRDALEQEFTEAEFGSEVDMQSTVDAWIEMYEEKIAELEQKYETAPEEVEPTPCDFTYHTLSYYYGPESGGGWDLENILIATAELNGLPYRLQIENFRAGSDNYQFYDVNVDLEDLDESGETRNEMFRAAGYPSEEVVAADRAYAEELIADMGIGDWAVTSQSVEFATEFEDGTVAYWVKLHAAPVYNGVAATEHIYSECYDENAGASYAADYDETGMDFQFIGSTLDIFRYTGPVAVTEQTNDNVATLSFEEIMEKLRTVVSLRDSSYYTTHGTEYGVFQQYGRAEVSIDEAVLGLTRIRVQDSDTDYYFVPTYTFYGSVAMYDEDGNQLPYYISAYSDAGQTLGAMYTELAVINAVDGSFIDTTNYYY